jgi:V/A-type H+-transporting ATPase subunit I
MGSVINMLGNMIGGVGEVVLLVAMHLFNLVLGLLSIYIHNGRLQYVEFFGKFYEGDGKLFTPFGSDTKYTLIKD